MKNMADRPSVLKGATLSAKEVAVVSDRYVLLQPLGQGGMGTVYRASDRLTGQTVALKRVRTAKDQDGNATLDTRLALAQEFRLLATLRHPNVITVLDYGFDDDGQPFFAMDMLEDAQDIITVAKRSDLNGKVTLVAQMLQALAYLHRRGIVHRDLKPENLLVTNGQLKLLDFGISSAADLLGVASPGTIGGTLAYLAPELLRGAAPAETSDLYAVGILLYEMLAGRHPFNINDAASLVYDVMNTDIDMNRIQPSAADSPQVIAALRSVIRKLLYKHPEHRYQRAGQVIELLCSAAGIPAPPETGEIRDSFLKSARFVGRTEEFSQLRDALGEASLRRGSVWLVGGESGVGKSRVLEELRAFALVRGALVVRGQAAAEGSLPYHVWREPVRRLVLSAALSDLEAGVLKPLVPDITRLLGRTVEDAPPLDAEPARLRLAQTIIDMLRRQRQTAVILLEDLHWTRESFDLLKTVSHGVIDLPVLIVGSYRDDERPDIPDLLPNASVIRLKRFSNTTIAELSRAILGPLGGRRDILTLLERETEGNVFFVIEVLRALADSAGRLDEIGDVTLPRAVVTGGVRAVLQRRIQRLPADAVELLQLAAVAGRHIDPVIMNHVTGTPERLEAWFNGCANAAVLEFVDDEWRFTHDKLRETLLESVPDDVRPRLHRSVAHAIEKAYPDEASRAVVLAEHYRIAGDADKHLHYLLLSARQARAISRHEEARRLCQEALELLTHPDDQRMQTLRLLGDTYADTNEYRQAEKTYHESLKLARRLSHISGAAEALIGLGTVSWRQGALGQALQLFGEGLALAQRANSIDAQADAYNGLGVVAFDEGDFAESREKLEKSLRLAQDGVELWRVARNYGNLAQALVYLGEVSKARDYYEIALELYRQIGDRRNTGYIVIALGAVLEQLGEAKVAVACYTEGISTLRAIGAPVTTLTRTMEMLPAAAQDVLDASIMLGFRQVEALQTARQLNAPFLECSLLWNIAKRAAVMHDPAEVKRRLADLMDRARDRSMVSLECETMAVYARMLASEKRLVRSAELTGLLSVSLKKHAVDARVSRIIEEISPQMTADEFTEAHDLGKLMSLEAVLDQAIVDLRRQVVFTST
ncbi:MAG: serine/threonine-protein kinase PknK [Chloroflexi bacterium]|nr:MAG: serine/threonine protein kinase [Chloroflexi bacterium OLB13]MBC6954675.1 serine/threonine-protein kinase PknK [Chloroflexota bacterium]MBV6435957.1 Serine/threonine-protein kinase PknD [Anaerolineae bacterium]MDL1916093.1 tetratricopeptide repeat protein [Anaerolineae bacterium CFX4]OQY81079.1 MAG: hypothetical protein B6D42_11875 [Anaerolineae bacterium UTCFX5]